MRLRHVTAALALLALPLAACLEDDTLRPPSPPEPAAGALFQRYVALGNSITAGFQSAGINDSLQARSYAVLLAQAMGADFVRPSLNRPGCPPPFTNNVTQKRDSLPGIPGPLTGSSCFLRANNRVPGNLAVPGARATEILTNFGVPVSASNALTLLFLGGRTQLEAMAEQDPTFVSLWIGNNDVLGSLTSLANPGDPARVTTQQAFQDQYTEILDGIEATGAEAVLISVADVSVIPYASRGSIYWCLKNAPACGFPSPLPFPPTLLVANNCAPSAAIPGSPGDSILVPWPIGLAKANAAIGGTVTTIDCSVDAEVVTPTEFVNLKTAVAGFNAFIQAQAAARGWAYVDVNPPLLANVANGTIPAFPDITQAFNNPPGNVGFGALFSLDGVHPSTTAHRLVADSVASAINQRYGAAEGNGGLPVPVCGAVTCPN